PLWSSAAMKPLPVRTLSSCSWFIVGVSPSVCERIRPSWPTCSNPAQPVWVVRHGRSAQRGGPFGDVREVRFEVGHPAKKFTGSGELAGALVEVGESVGLAEVVELRALD